MKGLIGLGCIVLALAAALAGCASAILAARRRSPEWLRRADMFGFTMAGLVTVAVATMVVALVTHDFSVQYVAQVGSRATPLLYTVISLWSALEGSILLWMLLLVAYTVAVILWRRRRGGEHPTDGWVLATLFGISVFFLLLISWPANPYSAVSPVPEDGPGPNALLQNNPFMAVHPPLLYLGYVGMAVPYAFLVGALLTGTFDRTWALTIRRWLMVPWTFLSLGIIAGMWWSYETLGWGGYWAWDPVENASFLPWLTATAFLHSLMVQERRGFLKAWNASLIAATFLLTIFGTFVTRSGVIQSVHAFTASLIGPFFFGFLTIALIFTIILIANRSEALAGEGSLDSPFSRETAFLLNNLLFTCFTFTVLLGTLFPMAAEMVRGVKVSVGAPFYNRMTLPICMALVFLVGVGPALPWGRGSRPLLSEKLGNASAAGLVLAVIAALFGVRHPLALGTVALAAFSFALLIDEILIPVRVRRGGGEGWLRALRNVMTSNRRRYGGYIVHSGILMIAVAVAISSAYKHEGEWTLEPGESANFHGYTLRLDSLWAAEEPQRDAVVTSVTVERGGDFITTMQPRLNYYRNSMEPIATPSVREGAREDLYLVLAAFDENGTTATIRAIIQPLVVWIWIGGLVVGAGAVFAWWPGERKRKVPVAAAQRPAKRRKTPGRV